MIIACLEDVKEQIYYPLEEAREKGKGADKRKVRRKRSKVKKQKNLKDKYSS
jgi:hypothetical protein